MILAWFFFFKQKTAYEMRISDWSSDVCSSDLDKAVWLLLHANHEREFVTEARAAIAKLVDAGIPVLGQSVLLKGVNDTPDALAGLFRAMVRNRVKPHYLHHGDLARGTGHFRLSLEQGRSEEHTSELQSLMRSSYAVFC